MGRLGKVSDESCASLIFISIFLILNLQIDMLVRPDNVPEIDNYCNKESLLHSVSCIKK
jgi:hypothetical protein